jgi:hypothetical protein
MNTDSTLINQAQSSSRRPLLWGGLGCAGCALLLLGISCVACFSFFAWIFTFPEAGVYLSNEVPQYALDQTSEHDLLQPDEDILAYYDATMRGGGWDVAIVTDQRIIHYFQGRTTSIPLEEISDIESYQDPFFGDVITVYSSAGQSMQIEITPQNEGETFLRVLHQAWEDARK